MDQGRDLAPTAADAGVSDAAQAGGESPDLDLDRLVWDPEYREAMRPRLKEAG